MEKYVYKGKNKEEIIESALNELNCTLEEIIIKETEEKSGLFQGKKTILEIVKVIKKLNIFERVDKYGLNKEIIEKSFIDLKSREDRYSIVNRYENKIEEKQKILKELYSIIDGEIELC